jgi:hypothetical protein
MLSGGASPASTSDLLRPAPPATVYDTFGVAAGEVWMTSKLQTAAPLRGIVIEQRWRVVRRTAMRASENLTAAALVSGS